MCIVFIISTYIINTVVVLVNFSLGMKFSYSVLNTGKTSIGTVIINAPGEQI